eukprot:2141034-Amphidinium_carterae.1
MSQFWLCVKNQRPLPRQHDQLVTVLDPCKNRFMNECLSCKDCSYFLSASSDLETDDDAIEAIVQLTHHTSEAYYMTAHHTRTCPYVLDMQDEATCASDCSKHGSCIGGQLHAKETEANHASA